MDSFNLPDAIKFIGSGANFIATIVLAFFTVVTYAAFHDFHYYINAAIKFAKSRAGILLITGGVFLLIGDSFEKLKFFAHYLYFEEMSELFGDVLILLSSLATNSFIRNTRIIFPKRQ